MVIQASLENLEDLIVLFDSYRQFFHQESDLNGARDFLRARMENEESVSFMAYKEGVAMGFAQLYPAFSSVSMKASWILNDLFVTEDARGQKVGEALLTRVIDYAKETGTKGVLLETTEDNKIAQNLYEKMGFIREENRYYFKTV